MLRHLVCTGLLALLASAACTSSRAHRPGRSPLPADSAAVLDRAIRQARPAFATHEEALRAGAYLFAADSARRVGSAPLAPADPTGMRPTSAAFVAQIAAFRDRASAEVLARDARQWFADLEVLVQAGGEWYRVVVSGWPTAAEAQKSLHRIQERFPAAWVRSRSVP